MSQTRCQNKICASERRLGESPEVQPGRMSLLEQALAERKSGKKINPSMNRSIVESASASGPGDGGPSPTLARRLTTKAINIVGAADDLTVGPAGALGLQRLIKSAAVGSSAQMAKFPRRRGDERSKRLSNVNPNFSVYED